MHTYDENLLWTMIRDKLNQIAIEVSAGVACFSVLVEEELFDQLGSAGPATRNNGMACWTPQGQHWSTSLLTERELSKDCWNHANCGFSISPCCVNLTSYSTRIIQIPGTRTSHMRTLKQRCGRLKLNYKCLLHTHNHNACGLMSANVREKIF